MTLLTLVQNACAEVGSVTVPNTVTGSTDPLVMSMYALAKRCGQSLKGRGQWQVLRKTSTFLAVAANLQGALTTLLGSSFDYLVGDTMWNQSQRRPIYGGLTPQTYELLLASNVTGPWLQYTIYGGNLYFIPVPTAGHTIAVEWMSKYWCQSAGGTPQATWLADSDVGLLDEDLLTLELIWRWKRSRGLDYAEERDEYEKRVADALARDAGPDRLRFKRVRNWLGNPVRPEGNWSI